VSDDRRLPRWARTLIKLAVAAAVVAIMVQMGLLQLDAQDLRRALAGWPYLVAALALLLFSVFLQSIRWALLLRPHGIRIPILRLYNLAMTGVFFSMIGPGGVGGDAVKAYLVARDREQRAAAATTVVLDRVVGLFTLLLFACTATLLHIRTLWHTDIRWLNWWDLPGGRVLILLIGGATALLVAGAAAVSSKRLRTSKRIARATSWLPFRATVGEIYRSVHAYRDHPGALLGSIAMSALAQVPFFIVYYLYGRAVGADIALWRYVAVVPPALVIRTLPILPGGAGQGAVALGLLFPLVGAGKSKGTAIGTVGDALFIVLYLVAGIFFLFGRTDYGEARKAAEEMPE
jgi:hypothetical protein